MPTDHVSSRCHVLCVLFLHCSLVQYISRPVFVHLIRSKKQWFARLTVKVQLHTLYYLSEKCLGFQACSFIKRCVSIFW